MTGRDMAVPERLGFAVAPERFRSGWRRGQLCLGLLAAAGLWALLRFGATASEDLYATFLISAAALAVATALLPRGLLPRIDGLASGLVVTVLCLQITFLPTFEARGYLRPALGFLALLLVSASLRASGGIRRVAWGLVATGIVEATWGIAGVLRTLGEAAEQLPAARGSLLNPNHLASWLNACLALGLGLDAGSRYLPALGARRDRWGESLERLGRTFAAGWMVLAVLLTGSRAGLAITALLGAGFALCSWSTRRRERRERREPERQGRRWYAMAGAALVVASLFLALAGPMLSEEEVLGLERRIELYRGTLELVADSPWTGSGPGLFAWAFRPYHRFDTHKRFRHAHNDFLETAADWGVPLAALVVGLLAWRLVRSWRQFSDSELPGPDRWLQWGAAAALSTFLLHGLVDFSLQIPSHLLLFAWILGLARAVELSRKHRARATPRALRLETGLRIVLGLAVVVAATKVGERWWALEQVRADDSVPSLERAVVIDPWAPSLHFRLGKELRDDLEHRDLQRAHEHLRRAVELNPLSWRYRYELGAFYEGVGREAEATAAWLAGLALDPHNPQAEQRVAAYFLRRGRPEQALPLLGQAAAADPDRLESIGELLLRSGLPLDEVVAWWPQDGASRAVLLHLLLRLEPTGAEPWIEGLWSRWLEQDRPTVEEAGFLIEHSLARGRSEEARRRWYELQGDSLDEVERVWNGDFEREPSEALLGWQTSRSPSMEWIWAPGEGRGGSAALRIELARTGKQDFRRLRQLVVVQPGSLYELRYHLRSEGLDSDIAFLQVVSGKDRQPLAEEAGVGGTVRPAGFGDEWVGQSLRVRVPEGVDRAWIRLGLRFPSASESLSGTLWIDDVSLRLHTPP